MRSLSFQLVHCFPALFILLCLTRADWALALPGLFFCIGIPLLDPLFGKASSPTNDHFESSEVKAARSAPYLYVLLYIVSVIVGLFYIQRFPRPSIVGSCVLTVGICAGLAFSAVHELIHLRAPFGQKLANLCVVFLCFGHFEIEHLYSHHRFAGTTHDTSTARLGESIYSFLGRSVPCGIRFAWRFEQKRLAKKYGNSKLSTARNRVLLSFLSSGALIVAVDVFFGLWPTVFFVLQSAVGIVLLMTAAYIQHYGILRKDDINLKADHVWDSNYRLSNWINFGVQRHAAHHLAPTRLYVTHPRYQEAPELPAGYPAMITLALVPFFWMRVMNHRVPAI